MNLSHWILSGILICENAMATFLLWKIISAWSYLFKHIHTCTHTHTQTHIQVLFVVVQSLSHVRLFATLWTKYVRLLCPPLSPGVFSNSCPLRLWCYPNHLILCHPLVLSLFSSIRGFRNELTLHIRWPKYWSFTFSINPSNEYLRLIILLFT